jgi:Zn-dependent metalloprotease
VLVAIAVVALGLPAAAAAATGYRIVHDVTTATGRHVWTQQTLDGLPVFGSYTYANGGLGYQTSVQRTFAKAATVLGGHYALSASQARAIALGHTRAPAGSSATASRVAFPSGTSARRAWSVRVSFSYGPGDWSVVVDAETGKVLHAANQVRFVDGTGSVFSPNPVITLGDPNLTDHNDANSAVPAGAYSKVTLHDLDGSGFLRGPWVDATKGKHDASLADEPSEKFLYQRHDDRFEAVMSYHWLDESQRYIQSIGFDNVNAEPQDIKVDDYTGDNSFYSPAKDTITYGIGGVDDAEDAEVILHEYGHAIQEAQVPGWGKTEQGGAMGEGFGDYWAGDQTAEASNGHGLLCIAEWDSTSYAPVPSCLRRLDSAKHFPEDMDGEVHDDGEMWSASLWQIRTAVGRNVANHVILEAHFLLNPKSKFAQGAQAILDADRSLYGGAHAAKITKIFTKRGIL